MQTHELQAEPRTILGKKVRVLRRQGVIPANIFGHGDSRAIQAPARAIEYLFAHGGRTGMVNLLLGEGGGTQTALVKGVTRDPRTYRIVHVDFQAVALNETVTTTVPLRFVGEPPAVKRYGAVLLHPTTELRVEAVARDLPESIEVDLSGLTELDQAIHASDIQAPTGVTILDSADEVLAMAQAPKIAAELAEEAAEAAEEAATAASEESAEAGAVVEENKD